MLILFSWRLKWSAMLLLILATTAWSQGEADTAAFVGDTLCQACHQSASQSWSHTVHAKVFARNPRTPLERRSCEACHGPGEAHVAQPQADNILGFTHGSGTPIQTQNRQCMACHEGGGRIHWFGSMHEEAELACSDCHNPMANFSNAGLLAAESVNETCIHCHKTQRAEFQRRSHMPLLEGKLTCTDCHSPHGSTTDPLLKADTVNETCYQCHAEKRGPFLWEHAPVREDCLSCHHPHGSNHEKLLITARPVLCQQCHSATGHVNDPLIRSGLPGGTRPDPRGIGRSCSQCHAQIHGSNHPSGARLHR